MKNLTHLVYDRYEYPLDVMTKEWLGDDYYYRTLVKTVNEAERFNYHSDYWGSADEYQELNVDLMYELEPWIGERCYVEDGAEYLEGTLVGMLIDKQYNSISHTCILFSDVTEEKTAKKKAEYEYDDDFYVNRFPWNQCIIATYTVHDDFWDRFDWAYDIYLKSGEWLTGTVNLFISEEDAIDDAIDRIDSAGFESVSNGIIPKDKFKYTWSRRERPSNGVIASRKTAKNRRKEADEYVQLDFMHSDLTAYDFCFKFLDACEEIVSRFEGAGKPEAYDYGGTWYNRSELRTHVSNVLEVMRSEWNRDYCWIGIKIGMAWPAKEIRDLVFAEFERLAGFGLGDETGRWTAGGQEPYRSAKTSDGYVLHCSYESHNAWSPVGIYLITDPEGKRAYFNV